MKPEPLNAELGNKLPLCPNSPNCVSSQAQDKDHFVAPFLLSVSANEAWIALKTVLQSLPRIKITRETEYNLHLEATSMIFRFIDDVEFILLPEQQRIDVRSASRTGRSDLGVNRERVELIRNKLQQTGVLQPNIQ